MFATRDAGALVDPATEKVTPELMVERHRGRVRKLADRRLYLPAEEPYLEGHNTWCVNVPGSLIPHAWVFCRHAPPNNAAQTCSHVHDE